MTYHIYISWTRSECNFFRKQVFSPFYALSIHKQLQLCYYYYSMPYSDRFGSRYECVRLRKQIIVSERTDRKVQNSAGGVGINARVVIGANLYILFPSFAYIHSRSLLSTWPWWVLMVVVPTWLWSVSGATVWLINVTRLWRGPFFKNSHKLLHIEPKLPPAWWAGWLAALPGWLGYPGIGDNECSCIITPNERTFAQNVPKILHSLIIRPLSPLINSFLWHRAHRSSANNGARTWFEDAQINSNTQIGVVISIFH